MSATSTAEGAAVGLREAMSCAVCSEVYEQVRRSPLVLPCGHTFCRACLTDIKKSGRFMCPSCRAEYNNVEVESLTVNYTLLNILPLCNHFECDQCGTHGDDLRYWCAKCDLPLCSICLYSGHPQGHNVKLAQTFVMEKKNQIAHKIKHIFRNIEERKKELKECFNDLDVRMKQILYKNAELQNNELTLNQLLEDTQTANNITSVLYFERRVGEFTSVEKSFVKPRKTRDQDSEGKEKANQKEEGDETEGATAVNSRDEQNQQNQQENQHANQQQQNQVEANDQGPDDAQEDEQELPEPPRAVIDYQDGRLLLHTLTEPSTSKLSLQMPTQVFIELGVGDRYLGRVYINLWCHMRQAQQFMALCTGVMGYSLRGSKVSEKVRNTIVFRTALDTNNQSVTSALMMGLEWGGTHSTTEAEGLVTGMAGNNGMAFGICTQGQTNAAMQAPFGMVVGGLEAANNALQHNPVTEVTIKHCGIVLPGLSQN